jgi:hypothetical protein
MILGPSSILQQPEDMALLWPEMDLCDCGITQIAKHSPHLGLPWSGLRQSIQFAYTNACSVKHREPTYQDHESCELANHAQYPTENVRSAW